MKKLLAISLVLVMCLSLLASCGSQVEPEVEAPNPGATEPVEPEVPETPAVPVEPEKEPEANDPSEKGPEEPAGFVFEGPGIFKKVEDVPESYKEAAAQPGTVEQVFYSIGTEEKYFNIYLPYGYDTSGETYNVVYLTHGGGGGPENFLRVDQMTNLQKAIDNMIQNGDLDPFILVSTTWKVSVTDGQISDGDKTRNFAQNELGQYVIPTVDANYRTNATRDGRAFGGFSMGGVTTWYTFLYAMENFKYFIPMSGDCWAVEMTGGKNKPVETVEAMEAAVAAQGFTKDDFVVYCFTGAKDTALPNLGPQINAMQDSEMFVFGENAYFGVHDSAPHGDPWTRTYFYNVLPLLWQH